MSKASMNSRAGEKGTFMTSWFDDMTKTLADGKLSRRQAVRRIAGTVAGAMVATYLPQSVFATRALKCNCPGNCQGVSPNDCGGCNGPGFCNCHMQRFRNSNCYCFTRLDNGKGECGCNTYCASVTSCAKQSDCSKGYTCITSTGCSCNGGICIQNCNKTCVLGASRAGRTAVGV